MFEKLKLSMDLKNKMQSNPYNILKEQKKRMKEKSEMVEKL